MDGYEIVAGGRERGKKKHNYPGGENPAKKNMWTITLRYLPF